MKFCEKEAGCCNLRNYPEENSIVLVSFSSFSRTNKLSSFVLCWGSFDPSNMYF